MGRLNQIEPVPGSRAPEAVRPLFPSVRGSCHPEVTSTLSSPRPTASRASSQNAAPSERGGDRTARQPSATPLPTRERERGLPPPRPPPSRVCAERDGGHVAALARELFLPVFDHERRPPFGSSNCPRACPCQTSLGGVVSNDQILAQPLAAL